MLADHSPGLQLLQRIRDEAHRFAITFHRQRRDAAARESMFDQIEGVGPVRRRALLQHFGSAERVLAASQEELEGVPGRAGEDGAADLRAAAPRRSARKLRVPEPRTLEPAAAHQLPDAPLRLAPVHRSRRKAVARSLLPVVALLAGAIGRRIVSTAAPPRRRHRDDECTRSQRGCLGVRR